MDSSSVLRPFQYAVNAGSHLNFLLERPSIITMNNPVFSPLSKLTVCRGKILSSSQRCRAVPVCCLKTSETTVSAKSNGDPNGSVLSERQQQGFQEKAQPMTTFPSGFETLLTEVCDETQIAELKVKFGGFEIHMKRSINGPTVPATLVLQEAAAPPVPILVAGESTPAPTPAKPSVEKVSPFTNVSTENAAKLAALEAGGPNVYVLVSSPTVGSFWRARTLKGKKQPPACKEGDVIKEGQVIGFVDQFGTLLPVKTDVAGEVLKLLYSDGDAVGYGDPLIAILPSFPGIK